MEVPLSNYTVEIFAVNLVGVHDVYGGKTVYDSPRVRAVFSWIITVVSILIFVTVLGCVGAVFVVRANHKGSFPESLLNPCDQIPFPRETDQVPMTPVPDSGSVDLVTNKTDPLKICCKRANDHLVHKDRFPLYYLKMIANYSHLLTQQFKRLNDDSKEAEERMKLTMNAGKLKINTVKNVASTVLPFDETRVILEGRTPLDDYINASFIPHIYRRCKYQYIATQDPLEGTVTDFWHVIATKGVWCIVMLTDMTKDGRRCLRYWPDQVGEEQSYGEDGDIKVVLINEVMLRSHGERVFELTTKSLQRKVIHLEMNSWSDNEAPSLHNFDKMINRFHHLPEISNGGSVLVHSRTGVGRAGTFICIDMIINALTEGCQELNIYKTVLILRHYRRFMVRTQAQYNFIYDYVDFFLRRFAKSGGF